MVTLGTEKRKQIVDKKYHKDRLEQKQSLQ